MGLISNPIIVCRWCWLCYSVWLLKVHLQISRILNFCEYIFFLCKPFYYGFSVAVIKDIFMIIDMETEVFVYFQML